MVFKKNKVWMAVQENEKPAVCDGKVLIKYRLDDSYDYWVHEKGLKPVEPAQISVNNQPTVNPRLQKKTTPGIKTHVKSNNKDKGAELKKNAGEVCIYTDGASSGNPGPSGIGVYFSFNGHEKEISKYIGIATNNIAELEAIKAGLMLLKRTDIPVRIFTDSSYALGVLSLGWKAKANRKLIESIKKIMLKFKDIKLIKVKGHSGIKENEKADLLATSAIKK